jgi:hypothetical protein
VPWRHRVLVAGIAVCLERSARQLHLDRMFDTLHQLLDQLGQAPLKVPRQTVEPAPHGGAHVERDARQIVMMALPIAPLPLRTADGQSPVLSSQT